MAEAKTESTRKRLVVSYNGDPRTPVFAFEGVWTGFDISTVQANIRRAYLRVKRDQRRAVSSETSNISAKGEES